MNVYAVSALLAGLLILAIGVSVVLRSRDRIHMSLAAFTFTIAAWHLCGFVAETTESPVMAWLTLWAAATIPPTAIAFFRSFLAQPSIGGRRRGPRVTLAWTFAAYVALIYSAVVDPIHDRMWFLVPLGAYVFGGLYRCVYDLFMQYRATVKRVERIRIGYLTLGGFVATTLALTDVLPRFGVAWPTVGNVLGILYLYFLSQTIFRSRLLDLNELIGKMVVLGSLVALLSTVYGVLLYWVGGGQNGLYLLNALVASFVILILFEPVRTRMEGGINRWILRTRHELRGRLDTLRRDLPAVVDVADMVGRIITALEESRRVTDASVYLLDADGSGFDRAGCFGRPGIERVDANSERALLERVRLGYLDVEVLAREADAAGRERARPDGGTVTDTQSPAQHAEQLSALVARASELRAGLVFPLLGSVDTEQGPWLLGLLVVRDDRAPSSFDLDDVDTFRQLASAAASVIESSQAYERVKERDRLAALGEMAAGLAHEIRNPLGAIKGAAQLLQSPSGKGVSGSWATESAELLEIIVEEANRLNNVVSRFLDYARADRRQDNGNRVDLNALVKKLVGVLQQTAEPAGVDLRTRLDELLPAIAGDAESYFQVFLNLGLNAIQAMPDGGTLEVITTRRRRSPLGYGQFVEVRFRDTGDGIARDKLKKLFIPFYTTKPSGTGLGLAISERIISQHGGSIEVRSTLGQGSTFSVFLPTPASSEEVGTTTGPIIMERELAPATSVSAARKSTSPSSTPEIPSSSTGKPTTARATSGSTPAAPPSQGEDDDSVVA